ncbi:MAG: FAD/NAD(P)-binding protein [Chloroflexi bacterium]|nr:FAD/NAD(P)-binding protein [Chloroflexota bacterium]MCL5076096.1 FAD/NAD(P)-binding protein [Chloroflexota bacterium]
MVREETYDTKTFGLCIEGERYKREFQYRPGQFIELCLLGYGESPLSIASAPGEMGYLELCVRRVGRVTGVLHWLSDNDVIGIRGPFGNGFPVEEMKDKNLVFVGGGLGLAPLRSLIWTVFANRMDFRKVTILYGARTPADLLFRDELKIWADMDDSEVLVTVDVSSGDWQGHVGVVTTLFDKASILADNSVAIVCGPAIMFRFVIKELLEMGFSEEALLLTLERHMKCGIGKCGHCNIGPKYVCLDGPVFRYKELKRFSEAF